MDKTTLNGIWNYYMSLEEDLSSTSRYIEPKGQEGVYSFKFAKLLVLAYIEIEAVFKGICRAVYGTETRKRKHKSRFTFISKPYIFFLLQRCIYHFV